MLRAGIEQISRRGRLHDPAQPARKGCRCGIASIAGQRRRTIFLWLRWMDAALCLSDLDALEMHARTERWTLDEVALSGKLVSEIVRWLYRENRLFLGTLSVLGRMVGPASMRIPVLAIVNTADEVAPLASVVPFIDRMPIRDTKIIEYPGEIGVGLQHLSILAGRQAYARVWPEIITWLKARS